MTTSLFTIITLGVCSTRLGVSTPGFKKKSGGHDISPYKKLTWLGLSHERRCEPTIAECSCAQGRNRIMFKEQDQRFSDSEGGRQTDRPKNQAVGVVFSERPFPNSLPLCRPHDAHGYVS
ncbi:hypothetical protein F4803DRAFT_442337 [Xylaria telfairii]|nr:hypothetical protein F4803DRAFT_442337 [Xylaria telfairii]